MLPRVQQTTNYSLFKDHEINRVIKTKTAKFLKLLTSMMKWGWWDTEPMTVYPMDRSGKHTIVKGHTRFHIAMNHKMVVKYFIDEQLIPLPEREDGGGDPTWSLADWVASHLKAGTNPNYQIINEYRNRTGIPISTVISLFMIGNKDSQNWSSEIRRGTLRITDTSHSEAVAEIVRTCSSNGIPYARKSGFVHAVSLILRTNIVSRDVLKKKIEVCVNLMKKKRMVTDYLTLLNEVYNYRSFPRIDLATEVRNAITAEKRKGMEKLTEKLTKEGRPPSSNLIQNRRRKIQTSPAPEAK